MKRHELRALQLALDRGHGASFLLRQALLILKDEAGELPHGNSFHYLQELTAIACRLQGLRPSMASIANGLQLFIDGLARLDPASLTTSPVEPVRNLVDSILVGLEQAYQDAVLNGADLIDDGICLVTCSFSATVSAALTEAASAGKDFCVLVLDSHAKPDGFDYGEMMASTLRTAGVACKIIPTDEVYYRIKGAKLGLVGADSILPHGDLINGWPTMSLARACRHNRIPFYSLCESIKFARDTSARLEKGFEHIPASFLTGVITEKNPIENPGRFDRGIR